METVKLLTLCIAFAISQASPAQSPSRPPAGVTGICKDGSFTNVASREGACRGHKGVQTWYNPGVPSLPAPALVPSPAATLPYPSEVPLTKSLSTPTPATSPTRPAPIPSATATIPAPTPGTTAAKPTPTVTSTNPALPPPQPGQVEVKYGIATERSRLLSSPPAPGGGPGLVWLNPSTKVYHCPNSDFYGRTKNGSYLPEADAKAQGAHPSRNKPCG